MTPLHTWTHTAVLTPSCFSFLMTELKQVHGSTQHSTAQPAGEPETGAQLRKWDQTEALDLTKVFFPPFFDKIPPPAQGLARSVQQSIF